MNSRQRIYIRTFGCFSVSVNGMFVEIPWPNETSRVAFCSLLGSFDEIVSNERLCQTLWKVRATPTSCIRLKGIIGKLGELFLDVAGINPFIMHKDGVSLNRSIITSDAEEFRQLVISGLHSFAKCERIHAVELLQKGCLIYTAPFLPAVSGKVVDRIRDELNELYVMALNALMPVGTKTIESKNGSWGLSKPCI